MGKKLTYEFVKSEFKKRGYELLEKKYINSLIKMKYKCKKHFDKELMITYGNLQSGHGCPFCSIKYKYTYEEIKEMFEKENYVLISDNIRKVEDLASYICLKHPGKIKKIKLKNFLDGNRCPECSKPKLNYNFIKEKFKKRGYTLLENEYINAHKKMKYKCDKHPQVELYITYNNFQRGSGCKFCGKESRAQKQKHNIGYIKQYIESDDHLILLTKNYINNRQKLHFFCKNHNQDFYLSFSKYKINKRCPICFKSKGEFFILSFLKEKGFDYKEQYSFNDCVYKKKLFFDFAIFKDNKLFCLIEYDGEFHYNKCFSGHDFEYQKIRDNLKNEYCQKNNIKLIRIPYFQFNSIKDILTKELL